MRYVWVITNTETLDTVVYSNPISAYNAIRKSIKDSDDSDKLKEYKLDKLAHSYSNSRNDFGIEHHWAEKAEIKD